MQQWLASNAVGLITLIGSLLALLIGFVKMNENMKNTQKSQQEEIDSLRADLNREKEQNKQNYLKQDEKLEVAISSLNARLDKIDEMNSSINSLKTEIATIKTDISYMKDDLKELKNDVRNAKND